MKVCFETFGCRLNRAEALQREAEYLAKGWERTEKHADADLIIVRGCSVTRRAQHQCEKFIDHLKRHYPLKTILIEGCLKKASSSSSLQRAKAAALPADPLATPMRTARAYLKVQDGCGGKCTFCIVPQFRGASQSVPFDDVLAKARRFIDAGYHEIVITGCNLSQYASGGKRFPDLMAALAALAPATTGDGGGRVILPHCRFRIGSLEPGVVAMDTVDVMAENGNICRFLHIPVQSGANRILTAMRRPYLATDVDTLIEKALAKMPMIGLGCDLITGFPGETNVDYLATKGLFGRHPFSNAHIFPFSARPGTIAAGLPDIVPPQIRHGRSHELNDIAKKHRSQQAKKHIGHDVELIIEDEKKLTGWTGEYFSCEITNKNRTDQIHRKDLVRVHVMDARHGTLKAILV